MSKIKKTRKIEGEIALLKKEINIYKKATNPEVLTLQDFGNYLKCPDCEKKDKEIKEVKKALELACDMIKDIKFKTNNGYNGDADFYNYFIEKAKEQLKDERN